MKCGLHCIKIHDMTVTMGGETIIEHVNLHIHCGSICAVIGKNGAGKSTLIRAILGEVPYTGKVEFKDLKDQTFHNLKIGYVPQHLNIDKNTPSSVYDLIASFHSGAPVFLYKNKKLYREIRDNLKLFQAEELIDRQVCNLSGGQLQRVLLTMAAIKKPNLLLLDEPVSGIDRPGMQMFFDTIKYLSENNDLAVVLISHDLDYVARYADQVMLLDKTVLASGTPGEVFESESFQKEFGVRGVQEV